MSFTGVLKVTDGTPENTVSFLATGNGIILNDWNPKTNKGKTTFAQSAFGDGRRMVMRNWDNSIEQFEVNITGADMDGTISPFRKLLRLLVLAGDYWLEDHQIGDGNSVRPFWIEALGDCESETRYAYIYDGDIPELRNPHDSPFAGRISAVDNINVFVEHGVWRDHQPGESECLHTYSYVVGEDSPVAGETAYPAVAADDATIDPGGASIDLTVLYIGDLPTYECGVRFTGVDVPNGATIVGAYAGLVAKIGLWDPGTIGYCDVFGELNATPAAFTTYANYAARARTASNGDFEAFPLGQNLINGVRYYTSNLASVIQEIVNLGGWASGGDMVLFFENPPLSIGGYQNEYYSVNDGIPANYPVLIITYEISGEVYYGVYTPVCEGNYAVGYFVNNQPDYLVYYDASSGVYSPNLRNTYPASLFPQPLGVGDRLYIGADYPFTNVNFYLNPAGDGTVTYVYKYSTAGGIASGSLTNVVEYPFGLYSGFANSGMTTPIFRRPSDWAKNSTLPILPSKYWLVIEITNIAVAPTAAPIQDIQLIYSTQWPFWEVSATEIGGDIEALIKLLLVQFETLNAAGNPQGAYNHLLIATRKYSRGASFMPYLNTQGNLTGVSFAATAPAAATANSLAPCGQSLNYSVAIATAEATIGTWTLTGATLTRQYQGRYRIFVRLRMSAGAVGRIGFRAQFIDALTTPSTVIVQTDVFYNTMTTPPGYDLVDLGILSFQNTGGLAYTRIDIALRAVTTGAATVEVLDIILFPVDERNLELYVNGDGKFDYQSGATDPGYQPLHDSTKPKEGPYSATVNNNDELIYTMSTKTMRMAIKPQERTRIYFLPWDDADGAYKGTESVFDGRFERVLQFLNMRGDS